MILGMMSKLAYVNMSGEINYVNGVFLADLTVTRCLVIVLAYRGTRMCARLVLMVRESPVC